MTQFLYPCSISLINSIQFVLLWVIGCIVDTDLYLFKYCLLGFKATILFSAELFSAELLRQTGVVPVIKDCSRQLMRLWELCSNSS